MACLLARLNGVDFFAQVRTTKFQRRSLSSFTERPPTPGEGGLLANLFVVPPGGFERQGDIDAAEIGFRETHRCSDTLSSRRACASPGFSMAPVVISGLPIANRMSWDLDPLYTCLDDLNSPSSFLNQKANWCPNRPVSRN